MDSEVSKFDKIEKGQTDDDRELQSILVIDRWMLAGDASPHMGFTRKVLESAIIAKRKRSSRRLLVITIMILVLSISTAVALVEPSQDLFNMRNNSYLIHYHQFISWALSSKLVVLVGAVAVLAFMERIFFTNRAMKVVE